MLKRLGMALLLAAMAAHGGALAKDKEKNKEKDKGKIDVTVTAPAAGASYTAPAAIVLAASATSAQASHPIAQVRFYQGTTLLGTATRFPYQLAWADVAAGNYVITAVAVNDKGDIGTSDAVALNVNAPPTVALTAPAGGASYTGPAAITLMASAADSDGSIARVEFYNGAILLGTATSAPYAFSWNNVAPGNYTITAKATDNQGAATVSGAIGINVNAVPTVALTAPASGASYTGPATITLTASAADSDGSIAQVEFYHGATLLGTATSAPYAFSWNNVAPGNYTITAKATDNQGAAATSTPLAIHVNAPPTVSLTAPASGASYTGPATITLTATAADSDGSIAKVAFYNGSTLLGASTAAPYTFTWTDVAPGNYTITAKATDNEGAVTTSGTTAIHVNARPTVSLTAPANAARYASPATITLTANAADSDGSIAQVDFYHGATLIGSATAAPYRITWTDVGAGNYSLTAKATDNQGAAVTSAVVSIQVNTAPAVALTVPADHQTFTAPASVLLDAAASDSDGMIARVEFFNGATLIGSLADAPYLYHWTDVAAGSYTLTAKATDNLGGVTTSSPVTIEVVANQAPAVSVTATPGSGAAPAAIALEAAAADSDGTIAKVEFFEGTTLLATVTQAPYRFDWSGVGAGTYAVTAKATDDRGASTVSAAVAVKVAAVTALQMYYIYADHLDTARVITDSNNNIVWRWDNADPFGNNVPDENPSKLGVFTYNPRFPGQYFDRETNLHYNYFRDYDPQTGRYIQSDPIGLEGGINTYAYVKGNPVNYVDPLGLEGTKSPVDFPGGPPINLPTTSTGNIDVRIMPSKPADKTVREVIESYLRWIDGTIRAICGPGPRKPPITPGEGVRG